MIRAAGSAIEIAGSLADLVDLQDSVGDGAGDHDGQIRGSSLEVMHLPVVGIHGAVAFRCDPRRLTQRILLPLGEVMVHGQDPTTDRWSPFVWRACAWFSHSNH